MARVTTNPRICHQLASFLNSVGLLWAVEHPMDNAAFRARDNARVAQLRTMVVAVALKASPRHDAVFTDMCKDCLGRGHVELVKSIDGLIARMANSMGVFLLKVFGHLDFVSAH